MKDGKRQFLTQHSQRLVIKPFNWKTFIQSPLKIFQSVVWIVECRDRLEGMDTGSFGNLQKSPEYFRHCSKVVEIFFGNADKMHTKVSLLWLRKREQFSVVLFAFLETRREFYWRSMAEYGVMWRTLRNTRLYRQENIKSSGRFYCFRKTFFLRRHCKSILTCNWSFLCPGGEGKVMRGP